MTLSSTAEVEASKSGRTFSERLATLLNIVWCSLTEPGVRRGRNPNRRDV